MAAILDNVDAFESDSGNEITVLLARIINRDPYSQVTTDFNDSVEAMTQERILTGDNIIMVDQESGRVSTTNLICWMTDFTPNITSTPPTTPTFVGRPYAYDLDATGIPAPTFALEDTPGLIPDGMTIELSTGLISWTLDASGEFEVTVAADNSIGTDTQLLPITVIEALCPEDMISYWKLDEDASPYIDSYGSGDATCTNCPAYAVGLVDGAQQFDGINDEVNVVPQQS